MEKIVIPVSQVRPEDDILELVEILKKLYPEQTMKVENALVIETDVAPAAVIYDILDLVEILKKLYPEHIMKVEDALVIETDVAPAAVIFRKIAGIAFI